MPAARPVLRRGEAVSVALVTCALGDREPAAKAVLMDGDGNVAARAKLVFQTREAADAAGVSRLSAELDGPSIGPGDYDLVISLGADGLAETISRIPVVIVDEDVGIVDEDVGIVDEDVGVVDEDVGEVTHSG